jgi:hypothetical protein
MPRHAFAVPGFKRRREGNDRKAPAQHAGREHPGFGQANNRNWEKFACAAQARISKSRDNGCINPCVQLGQHFQRDCTANYRFRTRGYIWNAPGCRGWYYLGAWRRYGFCGGNNQIRHPS